MSTYTWEPSEIEGHEVWYVYVNGQRYDMPFPNEDEAKDMIVELKREELARKRKSTIKKPGDDSGSSIMP